MPHAEIAAHLRTALGPQWKARVAKVHAVPRQMVHFWFTSRPGALPENLAETARLLASTPPMNWPEEWRE